MAFKTTVPSGRCGAFGIDDGVNADLTSHGGVTVDANVPPCDACVCSKTAVPYWDSANLWIEAVATAVVFHYPYSDPTNYDVQSTSEVAYANGNAPGVVQGFGTLLVYCNDNGGPPYDLAGH
jgi:hypothetical protein